VIEWVTGLVESLGYVGIAALMAVEMWTAVITSEMVMTLAGFTARTTEMSLTGAVVAGIVGTQAGGMSLYAACRWVPEDRVRRALTRHGRWLGLTEDRLRRMEGSFRENEAKAVLLGRLLPGLRGIIAVPAGLLGMRAWLFFACSAVGAVFWTTALGVLGYALGTQRERVDRYSTALTVAVVVLVAAYVTWVVVRRRRARQQRAAPG
jgi:membrane protein DedA with SNARE-associated domain